MHSTCASVHDIFCCVVVNRSLPRHQKTCLILKTQVCVSQSNAVMLCDFVAQQKALLVECVEPCVATILCNRADNLGGPQSICVQAGLTANSPDGLQNGLLLQDTCVVLDSAGIGKMSKTEATHLLVNVNLFSALS